MIITLIKNAESIKHKENEPSELTSTGASEVLRSGMMLLHFSGKRPLFSANDKGEYHLNLPQETIPEPSLILTGKESFSRQSGEMINAVFTNNHMADIDIQSNSIATNHPQAFLAQNNQLQHLIIVGSETCLNKWSHFACKDSDKRAKNSALCVIKDGHIIYDSETSSKRYMIEGVMDDMLIEGLNSEDPNRVSRIVEIFPEVEAEKLKPFAKKIGQAPTTASLLEQINRKQMGR